LLLAAQPQLQPETLLDDGPTNPRARLDAFMAAFSRYNFEWEPQLRTALRLSLESAAERPLLRRGRAIGWVEDALAPVRKSRPDIDVHRLAVAIRSATGIESLVWLLDIAGQTRQEAAETVRRTAQALLEAVLR
jgi:hypothetical protein